MPKKKKNYGEMTFGELMVASTQEMAEIDAGKRPAARRTRVTAREATASAAPTFASSDVRKIRKRLGLSQQVFAEALFVSPATVRGWEQGARTPEGPSRRLLEVADRHPGVVLEHVRPSLTAQRPPRAGSAMRPPKDSATKMKPAAKRGNRLATAAKRKK